MAKKNIRKIMSNTHWKLRRKGMSYKQAFNTVRKKAIPLKVKYPYKNYDKDNKVNRFDCEPKNKWKQDDESIKREWELTKNGGKVTERKGNYAYVEWDDGYGSWTTPSGNPPTIVDNKDLAKSIADQGNSDRKIHKRDNKFYLDFGTAARTKENEEIKKIKLQMQQSKERKQIAINELNKSYENIARIEKELKKLTK